MSTNFYCNHCGLANDKRGGIRDHIKTIHKTAVHECSEKDCAFTFVEKRELEQHKKDCNSFKKVPVILKGQNDETINLEVSMKTTISKIKEMLAERTGEEVTKIRLMHGQAKMLDQKILALYDLNKSDIIMSVQDLTDAK
ncbi:hypothetical protein CKAN_01803800 [Cinnamomum micranthum f. kanehirae]|uniref:Ubiquitin-like domain-containing protein n=1 Tax=Cinnamomum micranthum f. kanehirae TaxID=337451 RepID=A0A3S3MSL0_9MAGN|nr:hypothetical protein CKAN_01803800 [Cinnamomum micranthum f. kanehirae]